ncbi:MAG: YfcE family phosphodiesterase [Candidatus Bathyarchaeota archaeon]|nr:YfcE family phosphodiesterase [Candidatus Bathyarchaeota archaeon]
MNTQNTSPTCSLQGSFCRFGGQTILRILEGFEDLIDGVAENVDVECVHKTRVTSRRLRAALPIFEDCFPKKKFKTWSREIKNVTRLLSEARDLDVQIAFIEQYLKKLGSAQEQNALNVLLRAHKNCRKNIQASVISGIEELKASNTVSEIREYCRKLIDEETEQVFDSGVLLQRAHWHISLRLDDFLSMEKYVKLEKEKLHHHQMRIYAKKLRYTMEIFSPLYNGKLGQEISTIKAFQDVLGEIHDHDVWLEYLPSFKDKIKKNKNRNLTGINQALRNFATYVKNGRKKYYREFVGLWDNKNSEGFFAQLRKTTNAEFTTIAKKNVQHSLMNPHVKIAVLSDIHANLQALEKVLADAQKRGVEVFVNAGDSIGFGACPNEVVELLCSKNVLSIVGNYDLEVLSGQSDAKGEKRLALKFAQEELSQSCGFFLSSLPRELRLEVAGKKILVTHGSPESIDEHIRSDTPMQRLNYFANIAKADVVIVGHSHEQFIREANGVWFVNPGSVGRPNDKNPQAGYALFSFDPFKVDLIRLDYDVAGASEALRKKGLPESFAQMLLRGVSLDKIIEEDSTKRKMMTENCQETLQSSEEISKRYWPDTDHYRQVANMALALFDGLAALHKLGKRERCWLEHAAVLHDIGLSKGAKHHKQSAQLILNDTQLPFPSQDRRIIASIARYHRKALPKPKHYNLAALDRKVVQKISVLAGLLRVADSLDYTHQSSVKALGIKVGAKKVTVEYVSNTQLTLEETAFNKKKDLFEKVFNRKMVLLWKQP